MGAKQSRVLCYDVAESGWSDALTDLHEDIGDEDHYMNAGSREHALSQLERWLSVPAPIVLDIGCSSGYMVKALRRRLTDAAVVGADFLRAPLERLGVSMPDLPLLQFDLTRCPLPDRSVDGVVLLNVLEHVEDDDAALRQIYRILRPGGVAVIEVPAGPDLFDIYDHQLLHYRRYRMRDLLLQLRNKGFTIVDRSHLGFLVYPGFWAIKKRNRLFPRAGPEQKRATVLASMRWARDSRLMGFVMRIESRLRDQIYLPFGIRCVVTCRRGEL